jgi:hypothetical protein
MVLRPAVQQQQRRARPFMAQLIVTPSTSTRRYSKPGSRTGEAGVLSIGVLIAFAP